MLQSLKTKDFANSRSLLIFFLGLLIGKTAPASSQSFEVSFLVWCMISSMIFFWGVGLGTSEADPDRYCIGVTVNGINSSLGGNISGIPENVDSKVFGEFNSVTISQDFDFEEDYDDKNSLNNSRALFYPCIITSSLGGIGIWSFDGKLISMLPNDKSGFNCIASYQNNIISGSANGSCEVWNRTNGKCLLETRAHLTQILSINILIYQNNPCVISCSEDGFSHLWSLINGSVLKSADVKHRHQHIHPWKASFAKKLSDDRLVVVFGGASGEIHLKDFNTLKTNIFQGHFGSISALQIFDNKFNQRLISASADWTIRIWDLNNSETHLYLLEGHSGPVEALSIYNNSIPLIISSGRDGTVRCWDIQNGKLYQTLESDTSCIHCIAVFNGERKNNSQSHVDLKESNHDYEIDNEIDSTNNRNNSERCREDTHRSYSSKSSHGTDQLLTVENNSNESTKRKNRKMSLVSPLIVSCETEATMRLWNLDRIVRNIKWERRKQFVFLIDSLKPKKSRRKSRSFSFNLGNIMSSNTDTNNNKIQNSKNSDNSDNSTKMNCSQNKNENKINSSSSGTYASAVAKYFFSVCFEEEESDAEGNENEKIKEKEKTELMKQVLLNEDLQTMIALYL